MKGETVKSGQSTAMKIEPASPVPVSQNNFYRQVEPPAPSLGKDLSRKLAEDAVRRVANDFKKELSECQRDLRVARQKIEEFKQTAIQAVDERA